MKRSILSFKVTLIMVLLCQSACELYDGVIIEGWVIDAASEQPLPSATVVIQRRGLWYSLCPNPPNAIAETITGSDGRFDIWIPGVESNYELVVSKAGYYTQRRQLDYMHEQFFEIVLGRIAYEYD